MENRHGEDKLRRYFVEEQESAKEISRIRESGLQRILRSIAKDRWEAISPESLERTNTEIAKEISNILRLKI